MNQYSSEIFSVGEWRVVPPDNEIHRTDDLVQLEPKVMALLVYLAENAGKTVSREELFDALWPGVVVSDDTLTQAVIKLRKALGDSAKNARYIQTVPKRGYRLCTEVRLRQGAAGKTRSNTSGSRGLYAFLGLAVFLLVLSVIYSSPGETPPPEKVVSVESVPTLTVHPFVLLGGDKTQAYLAQGLTFDLITDLSKLSGLWVIGSRSIMGQKSDEPGKTAARYQASGEV
ncbi:MAG: winged helix-turn-helix domain-containing protein, partial [Candidatus Sedimenticola sp. 6PFRAG5]